MSAAAGSRSAASRNRARLRSIVARLDDAVVSGRLPALIIVIVTGLTLWAFLFTDDFRVETVTIEGMVHGNGSEVVDAAAMLDRSAFRVQPERAAERIAALPYVEHVVVDLEFPGQATIRIVERTPVLNVETGGQSTLVSADATTIASGRVEGLPRLRVDSRGSAPDTPLTPNVVAAVESIAAVYGPDASLIWNPEIGLVMEMPGGALVNFGEPEDLEAKLVVLAAIEDQIDDWRQLDLSVPSRPAYR